MVSPFFKRGHLNQSEQLEILKKIGSEILKEAPHDWRDIVYSTACTIDHSSDSLDIVLKNGDSVREWPPISLGSLVDDLRAGMFQEGKGTWFSLRYVISRPGNFKVDYNYDEDPRIVFPTPQGFTNDLKYFPRNDEHIPDWLRDKLNEEAEGQVAE